MRPMPVTECIDNDSLHMFKQHPRTPLLSSRSRSRSSSVSYVSGSGASGSSSDSASTVTANTEPGETVRASVQRKRRDSVFQLASPAPKRVKNAVLDENLLCEHCQQIDFQKVIDINILSVQVEKTGVLLANLGNRCNDPSTASKCPLCYLFHQSRVQHKSSSECQLRIYSYLKSTKTIAFGLSRKQHRAKDIPCLGVVPTSMKDETFRLHADVAGHIFCFNEGPHDDSLFNLKVPGQNAALSQVKSWLNYCASNHSLCRDRESRVSGLKLLDCEISKVVLAPANAIYVALSYVWGTGVSHSVTPAVEYGGPHVLDPRFTKTIRDAAVATTGLGYKYLWIDKLCIDQRNTEEKHHQISQMDSIYGSADLTIIAACGQDCHYGLPGVNGTPRAPIRDVKLGNTHVFCSMRHPHHQIQSSKWFTRGWTLQEACLSTRRVVFTDSQIYFECNTMHCSETVILNLDLIHDPKKMFIRVSDPYSWAQRNLYMNLVVQYTKRTLTFEEDRPKAFAGIMRHFARKEFFELWGVSYGAGYHHSIQASFICGLLWAHRNPLAKGRYDREVEDRTIDMALELPNSASIPSWSWMRWRGEVLFPQSSILTSNMVHNVQLEPAQGSWISLHYFHSGMSAASESVLPHHTTLPKVLLLDVDCVPLSEISLDETGNLKVYRRELIWYISRGPLQPQALYKRFQSGNSDLLLLARNLSTNSYFL